MRLFACLLFLFLLTGVTARAEIWDDSFGEARRARIEKAESAKEEIKAIRVLCDADADGVVTLYEVEAVSKSICTQVSSIKSEEDGDALDKKYAQNLRVIDFLAADQDDDNRVTQEELTEFMDSGSAMRVSDADLKPLRRDYDRWKAAGLGHSNWRISCCGTDWFEQRSWEESMRWLRERVIDDRIHVLSTQLAGKAWLPFLCKKGRSLTYQRATRENGGKWDYHCGEVTTKETREGDEICFSTKSCHDRDWKKCESWGPHMVRNYPKPKPQDVKPIAVRFDCTSREEKCVTPGLTMNCIRYDFIFDKAKVSVWFSKEWPGLEVKRTFEFKPSKKKSTEVIESLVAMETGE